MNTLTKQNIQDITPISSNTKSTECTDPFSQLNSFKKQKESIEINSDKTCLHKEQKIDSVYESATIQETSEAEQAKVDRINKELEC